jgi:UDP-N-acetylglucosamine/UDP-N-acetylgalactosamine diphosphorylase
MPSSLPNLFHSLRKKGRECPKDFLPLPSEMVCTSSVPSPRIEKMACLILAGGQGTRFGSKLPKGITPFGYNPTTTLFQIILSKIQAKGKHLPVAIMTSPFTHDATRNYLEQHDWFGLDIELFQQDVFPMCDEEGNMMMTNAPDGNGKVFSLLVQRGIWEKWRDCGIKFVQVIPIDNPLANPFDEELISIHEEKKVELVLRAIERNDPKESLGIVGVQKGRLSIQEYSEWDGRKGYTLGNTGLFSCSMPFIQRVADLSLPWHLARKKHDGKWVWKFEKFIFDLFPYADTYRILLSDRNKCFAPIKTQL